MKRLWLTYAWKDDERGDVAYAAKILTDSGIAVLRDRWEIVAGQRLWEQIATFISSEERSDGWAIYLTEHSAASAACREELSYALDRALKARGESFPIIGLLPNHLSSEFIPSAIGSRLYVPMADHQWVERVCAALDGRAPEQSTQPLLPYDTQIHRLGPEAQSLELRPRHGVWAQPFVAIPTAEQPDVAGNVCLAARGGPPSSALVMSPGEGPSREHPEWWIMSVFGEATPATSMYFSFRVPPTRIVFGAVNGPQYEVSVSRRPDVAR